MIPFCVNVLGSWPTKPKNKKNEIFSTVFFTAKWLFKKALKTDVNLITESNKKKKL